MTITTTQTWQQFLDERFTDADEVRDVANYGCAAGVNGFIYSSELHDIYSEWSEEIDEILSDLDVPLTALVDDVNRWTSQEIAEKAVWIAVEEYCTRRVLAEDE